MSSLLFLKRVDIETDDINLRNLEFRVVPENFSHCSQTQSLKTVFLSPAQAEWVGGDQNHYAVAFCCNTIF